MRHAATLCALLAVACESTTTVVELPDEPATPVRDACPLTSLPSTPPVDLRIGVSRTKIPRGGVPQTARFEVGVEGSACVPPGCVAVEAAAQAALYDAFVATGFHRWATRPTQRSPHAGSRFVWLHWGDQQCDVGYNSTSELVPAHATDFETLTKLVWDVARRTSVAPGAGDSP